MKKKTTLKELSQINNSLIAVHWNGVYPVFVKCRTLSTLQIKAIASISLIRVGKTTQVNNWQSLVRESDIQHKLVKASLISPTYEQIMKIAKLSGFSENTQKEMLELEREIFNLPEGPEKKEFEEKIAAARLLTDLILPNDFTSDIVKFALQEDRTEINLVTEEVLMNCIALQSRSGGRPSDYCEGILSPFNKLDIDEQAFLLKQRLEDQGKGKSA